MLKSRILESSATLQGSGIKKLRFVLRQQAYLIKFEELKLIEQLLNLNEFVFKFDIKQASNCIDIYESLHAFLEFS